MYNVSSHSPRTALKNKQNKAAQYLLKEILEANPQQIILKIYDVAIVNSKKRDLAKTNNAIQELINSLKFDDEKVKEISMGLLRLYKFCQEQMRKKNYDIVYKILTDLRETWTNAFNN